MHDFADLITSRREWIDGVLQPWCRQAALKDLREAELEWPNLAGSVDPAATLWLWAWSRFPALVYDGLNGLNETREVQVTLRDGRTVTGYPDGRQSQHGQLVLIAPRPQPARGFDEHGPFSIDEVVSVAAA